MFLQRIDDRTYILIWSILVILFSGWRTYVAWKMPNNHKRYVDMYAKFFSTWPSGGGWFWRSNFKYGFVRFVDAILLIAGILSLTILVLGVFP